MVNLKKWSVWQQNQKTQKKMEGTIMNVLDEVKENMTSEAYNTLAKALQASHKTSPKYVELKYVLTTITPEYAGVKCCECDSPPHNVTVQRFTSTLKYVTSPQGSYPLTRSQQINDFFFKGYITNHWMTNILTQMERQDVALLDWDTSGYEETGKEYFAVIHCANFI